MAESDPPRAALVLSGGGARAAYQVGVLRYIGRRRPEDRFPILCGVSAGAINIAYLAAHPGTMAEATRDLAERWSGLRTPDVVEVDPLSLTRTAVRWLYTFFSGGSRHGPRARSLVNTAPLRRFLEEVVDVEGIRRNLDRGRIRDLAVSTTSYRTGRTVTFVHGPPGTVLWNRPQRQARTDWIGLDHVMASSALPLLFPAVKVDGGWFGDGSIRQSAPLAPAVHLGADRILSISARYDRSVEEAEVSSMEGYPPPAQVAGLLLNNIFLDTLDADAARLERINLLLERCQPGERRVKGLRPVELLVLRPSRDLGLLAAEHEQRLPRTLRFLVRGLGGRQGTTADFVSYLLFEPEYLHRLVELGERDAERQWPRIRDFLGRAQSPPGDASSGSR